MKTILDLAKQAGLKFDSELSVSPQEQKFAELIIQECAQIGELKEQCYNLYNPEMSVGWYMKQYFGVSE